MEPDAVYVVIRTQEIEPGTPVILGPYPSERIARRYAYYGRTGQGEGIVSGWEIMEDPELEDAARSWEPRGRVLLEQDIAAEDAMLAAQEVVEREDWRLQDEGDGGPSFV